jgi:hypothetical protein
MSSELQKIVQSHVFPLLKANGFMGRGPALYKSVGDLKYAIAWQSCAKLTVPGVGETAFSIDACIGSPIWYEMLGGPADQMDWSLFQMRMSVAQMVDCPKEYFRSSSNVFFVRDAEDAQLIGNAICQSISNKVLPIMSGIATTDALIEVLMTKPLWRYKSELRLQYDISVWRGTIDPKELPFLVYWKTHDPDGFPSHLLGKGETSSK